MHLRDSIPKSNIERIFNLVTLIVTKSFSLITLYLILDFIRDEDVLIMVFKNPFEGFAFVIAIAIVFQLGKIPYQMFQSRMNGDPYTPTNQNYKEDYGNPCSNCPRKGNDEH